MLRLLLLAPLVLVNCWHICLLVFAKRQNSVTRNSISESALTDRRLLLTHRMIHLVSACCLIIYAALLIRYQGFIIPGILLIIAGVFDVLETFALDSRTQHEKIDFRDKHQLFAWLMALMYLLFAVVYAATIGIQISILVIFLVLILGIALYAKNAKREYFWVAQMAFFLVVSSFVVLSNEILINSIQRA